MQVTIYMIEPEEINYNATLLSKSLCVSLDPVLFFFIYHSSQPLTPVLFVLD